MTIHIISVGISLLNVFDDPRRHRDAGQDVALSSALLDARPGYLLTDAGVPDDRKRASDWIKAALTPGTSTERTVLANRIGQVNLNRWPPSVSAELDTFHRVNHGSLSEADVLVLVCSDTPRGLLAGVWNAVALTGDLDRVGYLEDPAGQLGAVRGRALVVRLVGMDTGLAEADDIGVGKAMRGLGILARHLVVSHADVPADEPLRCYLSGGYKAAIPYLIGMAEGVRSLHPRRRVDAVVLHEESRSAAIRLPMRWIDPAVVQQELADFDPKGHRKAQPRTVFLEGYAYQAHPDGGGWTLTPFGEGLRALFGIPEPGLF